MTRLEVLRNNLELARRGYNAALEHHAMKGASVGKLVRVDNLRYATRRYLEARRDLVREGGQDEQGECVLDLLARLLVLELDTPDTARTAGEARQEAMVTMYQDLIRLEAGF